MHPIALTSRLRGAIINADHEWSRDAILAMSIDELTETLRRYPRAWNVFLAKYDMAYIDGKLHDYREPTANYDPTMTDGTRE